MKTLKQMFQELLGKLEKTPYKLSSNDLIFLVKCWLTQKLQEMPFPPETEPLKYRWIDEFVQKELLGELEK